MDRDAIVALLSSLPEAEEYVHGGLPAFRIRGKPRFATMLDDEGVNLFPGEEGILAYTQAHPDVCAERWWGPRLAAVRVDYRQAPHALVEEIVFESYAARAPKRLLARWRGFGEAERD
jgi:hypothetical protein